MAETRKHRVEARDELDRALLAALGEPVRPIEPGSRNRPATDQTAEASGTAAPEAPHTAPFVVPGSTLGGFTFGAPAEPPRQA